MNNDCKSHDQTAEQQLNDTELAEVQGGFLSALLYLNTRSMTKDVIAVNKEIKNPSTPTKLAVVAKFLGLW